MEVVSEVRVKDGDTVEVTMGDGNRVSVRLAYIDAPERLQPYGKNSTQALKEFVNVSRVLYVRPIDKDRYGRTVGELYGDVSPGVARMWRQHVPVGARTVCVDAQAWMVRFGHAWAVRKYGAPLLLISYNTLAKESGLGMYADVHLAPIQPRFWRRGKREPVGALPPETPESASPFTLFLNYFGSCCCW